MSVTQRIKNMAARIPHPNAVVRDSNHTEEESAREVTIINFWRFNEMVEKEGLIYYLDEGYYIEVQQLKCLLEPATQQPLIDLRRILLEITNSEHDFDSDDWLYDELFMDYLQELEDRFLLFNVEELCQALIDFVGPK